MKIKIDFNDLYVHDLIHVCINDHYVKNKFWKYMQMENHDSLALLLWIYIYHSR